MSTNHVQIDASTVRVDVADLQSAIYRAALSLDAFLLNGIQYGVLQTNTFSGLLQKTSSNLLRDLASLEEQTSQARLDSQLQGAEVLEALRAKCEQLIEVVTRLSSFRTLPLEQVRSMVAEVRLMREQCVQLIQKLEGCFRTPAPFYQTRPSGSTAAVTEFLAHLEDVFTKEYAKSNSKSI